MTGIVNAEGTTVVTYTYDAWGSILSTTDTTANNLGTLNPLRYRGYIYDQEAQLYYLQSRYYNPEIGRFINADITVATGQRFIGCNMYAYCINNPTNYLDSAGTDAVWIQEEDNVKGMGHTGLLVEDEDGKWYFFYWGMESEAIDLLNIYYAVTGTTAKMVWKEIETYNCNFKTTEGVKKALKFSGDKNVDRSDLVTSTLYFEGDYSATCDYIESLKSQPQEYNLLNNNCVQQSVKALQQSEKMFATTYTTIPNVAYRLATIVWAIKAVMNPF